MDIKGSEPEHNSRYKHKFTSIILAIFFGPWTWLYTFGKDSWKLAFGLGTTINILVFTFWLWIGIRKEGAVYLQEHPGEIYDGGLALILPIIVLPISIFFFWLWAVIDSSLKSKKSLEWTVTGAASIEEVKAISISLAIITGPWSWLYSYGKGNWGFWLGLILTYSVPIGIEFTNIEIDPRRVIALLIPTMIWTISILDAFLATFSRKS